MQWTRRLAGSAMALILAVPATGAVDIVVYHNWASPAELAALNVLRSAVEARGDHWLPLSIPHDADGDMNVIELINAGVPPNIFLQLQPEIYRRLREHGQVLELEQQFAASGALEQFPAVVRNAITVDGVIVKVPATIHADAMIYYNRDVAEAADVDPESWASLDDMWADFDRVREAGYLPVSMGAQPWQVGYLTHFLVASLGEPGVYEDLYGQTVDQAVLDDQSLIKVFEWLRRFQQLADAGAGQRDWNMATSAVINGRALLQLQGDWMKGEWTAAGKVAGLDFGCIFMPGARHVPVTVDSWGLLGDVSAAVEIAERAFADAVVELDVQTRFAAAKGSTPVRFDARQDLDICSQKVLAALDRPDFALPTPHLTADPVWVSAVWEVANSFWSDPDMSPANAVAALRAQAATRR